MGPFGSYPGGPDLSTGQVSREDGPTMVVTPSTYPCRKSHGGKGILPDSVHSELYNRKSETWFGCLTSYGGNQSHSGHDSE